MSGQISPHIWTPPLMEDEEDSQDFWSGPLQSDNSPVEHRFLIGPARSTNDPLAYYDCKCQSWLCIFGLETCWLPCRVASQSQKGAFNCNRLFTNHIWSLLLHNTKVCNQNIMITFVINLLLCILVTTVRNTQHRHNKIKQSHGMYIKNDVSIDNL